jgi:lipopolysaccharide/colanic/teichoic acid biosynthesis glycosyltransferase
MRAGGVTTYPGKRWLDLAILVLLALPLLLVAGVSAAAVRLTSRGPVLFRQTRIGGGEQPFELLKFRTMIDAPDNPLFPDADRITSAGRWLRRLSLDELPQLWNVVRGEMSLVGPRPTLPYQLELFDERQRGRYRVLPGLTGLAQVRGRNEIDWAERVEHDLEYTERISLLLDLSILVRTPFVVFGSGVEGHPRNDPLVRDGTIADLDHP